jgi:hypothetical protein
VQEVLQSKKYHAYLQAAMTNMQHKIQPLFLQCDNLLLYTAAHGGHKGITTSSLGYVRHLGTPSTTLYGGKKFQTFQLNSLMTSSGYDVSGHTGITTSSLGSVRQLGTPYSNIFGVKQI